MIFSARTQMLSKRPVSEILKLYSKLGFKGVEFGLLGNQAGILGNSITEMKAL